MALNNELLSTVEGLTEEQKKAIVQLSANEEDRVIAQKVGETHGFYDKAFAELIGTEKPSGVKSTEFWGQQVKELKKQAAEAGGELKEQLATLKAEKESLEAKVKDGKGAEALKQQLVDKDGVIEQLKGQIEQTRTEWEGKLSEQVKEAQMLKIDNEFNKSLANVSLKSDKLIPDAVKSTFINDAKKRLLQEYQPDIMELTHGGRRQVFKKDGKIAINEKGEFLTAGDLLIKELAPILDTGKKTEGAGTGNGKSNGAAGGASIGSATTQSQAAEEITKELMGRGLARGTDAYQKEFDKAWQENNVPALPIQ